VSLLTRRATSAFILKNTLDCGRSFRRHATESRATAHAQHCGYRELRHGWWISVSLRAVQRSTWLSTTMSPKSNSQVLINIRWGHSYPFPHSV